MICIENAKVVLEHGILWDGVILADSNRISAVGMREDITIPKDAQRIDAEGAYVGPGFVDIHVHGGNGHMFYAEPEEAAAYFLSHGETTVLPALYYDLSVDVFEESIDRIRNAMVHGDAAKIIQGIYMEGPYMNPKYGGNPDKNKWRGEIKAEEYTRIVNRAGALAKVWAVAPERDGLESFMAYAKSVHPDTVFAVGHSEATPAQIEKLKSYGIKIQTHCMNATNSTSKWVGTRGSGPDEACFLDPEVYAELICDSIGIHVSPELQQLMLQIKGLNRMILISDSYVSEEPSPADLRHVTDLCFDSNGLLAGSRLTLDVACRNLMTHTNCGIAQAFLLAARNPARAVGLDREVGTIEVGKQANLVFVDDSFHVKNVMLNGILRQ